VAPQRRGQRGIPHEGDGVPGFGLLPVTVRARARQSGQRQVSPAAGIGK
jgi:hypothetical protein